MSTAAPVSRRELVGLIDAIGASCERRLGPYCERRLRDSLGSNWVEAVRERRRREGRPTLSASAGTHDPRFVLACLGFEPEFDELGPDARAAARQLTGIANKAFHHDAAALRPGDLDRAKVLLKKLEGAARKPGMRLGIGGGALDALTYRLVGGPVYQGIAAVFAGIVLGIVLVATGVVGNALGNAIAWLVIIAWGLLTRTLLWAAIALIVYLMVT